MSKEEKMESGRVSSSSVPVAEIKSARQGGTGNVFQQMRHSENIYYNMYAATNHRWFGMVGLLCRWKQSVFSLIWHDVVVFLVLYFVLSILYRYVLFDIPMYKQTFEMICIYSDRFRSSIPITFLIGFWVSQIVSRWWDQFMTLPCPDNLALKLVAFIPGRVSEYNLCIILVLYKIMMLLVIIYMYIYIYIYRYMYIFNLNLGPVSKTPSTRCHTLRKFVFHTCIKVDLC
jgi:hypothetical protein